MPWDRNGRHVAPKVAGERISALVDAVGSVSMTPRCPRVPPSDWVAEPVTRAPFQYAVAARRMDQQRSEGNVQKGTISSGRYGRIGRRVGIESRILVQFSSMRISAPYLICSWIHRMFPDPTADSIKYSGRPRRSASHPWYWVPLPLWASTITVAGDSNAIVRLRTAKFHFWTMLPGANWETATCSRMMRSCSRALLRGVASSSGVPSTAIVWPPRSMAVVMGNRVDTQRQPAEYGYVTFHQFEHQPPSPPDTGRRRVARSDHGGDAPGREDGLIAAHPLVSTRTVNANPLPTLPSAAARLASDLAASRMPPPTCGGAPRRSIPVARVPLRRSWSCPGGSPSPRGPARRQDSWWSSYTHHSTVQRVGRVWSCRPFDARRTVTTTVRGLLLPCQIAIMASSWHDRRAPT